MALAVMVLLMLKVLSDCTMLPLPALPLMHLISSIAPDAGGMLKINIMM
jgi:hypothetical protein